MTLKEQLIQEIEQAPEEDLARLLLLWQKVKRSADPLPGFMRFAGIAKDDASILHDLEQGIMLDRALEASDYQ